MRDLLFVIGVHVSFNVDSKRYLVCGMVISKGLLVIVLVSVAFISENELMLQTLNIY